MDLPDADQRFWDALRRVKDPEIPVLSVIELGIVRGLERAGEGVRVRITPTYSACPAMAAIASEIRSALLAAGAGEVEVETVLDPPWTTDWIEARAREKLRRYGISPPAPAGRLEVVWDAPVPCPRCGSTATEVRNEFGPTACRSIHYCRDCREPFEGFKPI
jgi:ring-1,2-phenylacetyl-CoA epoxidase subunit PaaD